MLFILQTYSVFQTKIIKCIKLILNRAFETFPHTHSKPATCSTLYDPFCPERNHHRDCLSNSNFLLSLSACSKLTDVILVGSFIQKPRWTLMEIEGKRLTSWWCLLNIKMSVHCFFFYWITSILPDKILVLNRCCTLSPFDFPVCLLVRISCQW